MKKWLSILLAAVLVLGMCPITAQAHQAGSQPPAAAMANYGPVLASGDCSAEDSRVTWTLFKNELLIVSGTGAMLVNHANAWDSYKTDIKRIIITPGVTTIDDYAFWFSRNLTDVVIPDTVTSIGAWAFAYCNSLTRVNIPDSVISIGEYAFSDCDRITAFVVDEDNTAYSSDERGVLFDKNKVTLIQAPGAIRDPYCVPDSVTTIGNSAFGNCDNLTAVTIPDSVTSIGEKAFYCCEALTEVSIPGTVTTIGRLAFESCYDMTAISVSEDNPNYSSDEYGVLFDKNQTTLIQAPRELGNYYSIPEGVTTIYSDAFSCSDLVGLSIPESVTSIGDDAFLLNSDLNNIYYGGTEEQWAQIRLGLNSDDLTGANIHFGSTDPAPGEVLASGYCGAQGTNLSWVYYKNGYLKISGTGAMANYGCYGPTVAPWSSHREDLEVIEIGDGVTKIGSAAFYMCQNAYYVSIGDDLEEIGESAFGMCINLKEFVFPDTLTRIGRCAFDSCHGLTAMNLPDSVTSIGESGFSCCLNLESITIPAGVTCIEPYTFTYCESLTDVTIPAHVIKIKTKAFSECFSLQAVNFLGDCPEMADDVFYWDSLTAYYPGDNATWTDEKKTCDGGIVVWKAFGDDSDNGQILYDGGTCGDDLTWRIMGDGTLVISGTGPMTDYSEATAPWYKYAYSMRAVTVEPGVTYIGTNAFGLCEGITSITLPETLVTIGDKAFFHAGRGRQRLSIMIPEGVTTIGEQAFASMSTETVSLPSTLKTVEAGAFQWGSNIKEVHVPDLETWLNISLGSEEAIPLSSYDETALFVDGVMLTHLVIPYGVTQIGNSQFDDYYALTSIQIPNTVTHIGDRAFSYEGNYKEFGMFTEVVFPTSVSYIGDDAFRMRDSLEKIVILNPDCEISPIMYSATFYQYNQIDGSDGEGEYKWNFVNGYSSDHHPPLPVVYGFAGSTAETYAREAGLEFVALNRFRFLDGAHSIVNPLVGLMLRIDVAISEFMGVSVDGLTVDPANYTVTEGSTIVTFSPAYTSTLTEGDHTVTVFFTEGVADTTITVSEAPAIEYGDVNADGKINTLDLYLLRKFLTGADDSLESAGVDINADGEANTLDLILLRRYLNGADVTLGPQ